MKALARQKRLQYSLQEEPVSLSDIRKIYKAEGIKIKIQDRGLKNLKAAYFNDDDGCDVLLNKKIPREPRIFALAHELKHHYVDRERLQTTVPCCLAYNEEPLIEKTAEVFAAEFIWPESQFIQSVRTFGITIANCTPESVVRFKRVHKDMPVSYRFIVKRLEWFRMISKGAFDKVRFKNLEYKIFGLPYYLIK
jgi:Zn-dependent peptidase ImmA (M78 family)